MKTVPYRRVFRAFDFDVEYEYRPNANKYQAILPKEIKISVDGAYFSNLTEIEQETLLRKAVIDQLSQDITFDTPDYPEFLISDVQFCHEEIDQ